jgi:hypothetical protein
MEEQAIRSACISLIFRRVQMTIPFPGIMVVTYDCEISLNIPGQQIMETIRNDDILHTRELMPQYV